MTPSDLHDLLWRIADIFEHGGAKPQAREIRDLANALAEESAATADEAISAIRDRLTKAQKPRGPSSGRPAPVTISVDEVVRQLNAATNEAQFRPIFVILKSGGARKALVEKVAHRYAKGPEKYRTKADALKDIEKRFIERSRAASELKYLEDRKVTPW